MRYFACIELVLEAGLPEYTVEGSGSKVVLGVSGDRDATRLGWVLELAVAALLSNHHPPIILDYT
jgi:hypothetical protein